MPNLIDVQYHQTGNSTKTNEYGMREVQERIYEVRDQRYLLLKSPPASGKSRALMFVALDKLTNQGVRKVIVAVPERSIGSSFKDTELMKFGFYADWKVTPRYNLCSAGSDQSKVKAFKEFMGSDEQIIVATHATLRFAFEEIETKEFQNCMLAIDEFHHVSADGDNRLGELLRSILNETNAHVLAMTGSYFRGDGVPVLLPEDESKFHPITYNYYEQLNGYTYLKSLGIGYHFYQGKYTSAIEEILDTDKKTILHIPSPNSGESTKDKHSEVDFILDSIGEVESQDMTTGVINVKRKSDGKMIKVADLVDDRPLERGRIMEYLRNITDVDDMDLIIALGMAKEGFDWSFCEHALTVGYRGSLTEIIQIIGRATRDSNNKTHAQFTNLIAQPDASDDNVKIAVNNMLKAITASLLMEQVMAPNFKFKTKRDNDDTPEKGTIKIKGFKEPTSQRVKEIIEKDLNDLKAKILQDDTIQKLIPADADPEVINQVYIPKIIKETYPELREEELEELRQYTVVDSVVKNGEIKEEGNKKFIRMAGKFVNIDDLHIDLIDSINPFQRAYEILSKSVDKRVLSAIQQAIAETRIQMTEEEAIVLYPKIKQFIQTYNREPMIESVDFNEQRLGQALVYLRKKKRERQAQ